MSAFLDRRRKSASASTHPTMFEMKFSKLSSHIQVVERMKMKYNNSNNKKSSGNLHHDADEERAVSAASFAQEQKQPRNAISMYLIYCVCSRHKLNLNADSRENEWSSRRVSERARKTNVEYGLHGAPYVKRRITFLMHNERRQANGECIFSIVNFHAAESFLSAADWDDMSLLYFLYHWTLTQAISFGVYQTTLTHVRPNKTTQ